MRNLLIILVFLFCAAPGFAQGIEVSETERAMQIGNYNSFLFELPEVSKKEAEEAWKAFMSDFKAKTKYDRKQKIWFSDDATIAELSDNTVDVYARILEGGKPQRQITMIVWFDLGGAFVSSEADRAKGAYAGEILAEYGATTIKNHAEALVKAEEKELNHLERDLKKLRKDRADYQKEIEKAMATIAKMEKNIEINEKDQAEKVQQIEQQKGSVTSAKKFARKYK